MLSRVDLQNLICLVQNEIDYFGNNYDPADIYYTEEREIYEELLTKLNKMLKKKEV